MSAQDAVEMKAGQSADQAPGFFDPFLAVVAVGSLVWIAGLTWAARLIF